MLGTYKGLILKVESGNLKIFKHPVFFIGSIANANGDREEITFNQEPMMPEEKYLVEPSMNRFEKIGNQIGNLFIRGKDGKLLYAEEVDAKLIME